MGIGKGASLNLAYGCACLGVDGEGDIDVASILVCLVYADNLISRIEEDGVVGGRVSLIVLADSATHLQQ